MPSIGDSKHKIKNRVVKFFLNKLHYTYWGNLHYSENRNIMQELLYTWLLKQWLPLLLLKERARSFATVLFQHRLRCEVTNKIRVKWVGRNIPPIVYL